MNVIIKPKVEKDLERIEQEMANAFESHDKFFFTFDLTETSIFDIKTLCKILPILKKYQKEVDEKLEKTYIILDTSWKKTILMTFFYYYKPRKPVEFIKHTQLQNHGLSSNVLE